MSKSVTFENINEQKNMFYVLLKTAIPSSIVQFINALLPFVNLFFMTHYFPSSTPSSNIISVITPSIWLLNAFCYFPIMGTSVSYAMMISKKKFKEANDYASTGFFIGLVSSTFVSIIGWFAVPPFLWVTCHGNQEVYLYSVHIMRGLIIGYPVWTLAFFMSFMIRNYGWIWKSMLNFFALFISVSLFEFLFLQFIYLPDSANIALGFSLIGYSNSLGYVVIFLIAFCYLHIKKGFHFKIDLNKYTIWNKNMLVIMKMGSSSFILNLGVTLISFITNIAFAWIVIPDINHRATWISGSSHTNLSNSNYWQFIFGSILPIWIMFLNPTYGINAASRLLLAHTYARKNEEKLKELIKYSFLLNFIYLMLVEFIILVAGSELLGIFHIYNGVTKTIDNNTYALNFANNDGRLILGIIGLLYFAYSVPAINLGMAQVLHKSLLANLSAIQRPVIIEITIVIIATTISHFTHNPWIFWWSYPIMDFLSLIMGLIIFRRLYRRLILMDDKFLEGIYKKHEVR